VTKEQMLGVVDVYAAELLKRGYSPKRDPGEGMPPRIDRAARHAAWMLEEMRGFLAQDRWDKANRWLGFVQGLLWSTGIYTIPQMANHNRPPVDK
jgi:hypothetical protein